MLVARSGDTAKIIKVLKSHERYSATYYKVTFSGNKDLEKRWFDLKYGQHAEIESCGAASRLAR